MIPFWRRIRFAATLSLGALATCKDGTGPEPPRLAAVGPVPAAVFGTTYVWDEAGGGYRADHARTGAPADGVRFRLYAASPSATGPVLPLRDIGYVDLANREATEGEAFIVQLVAGTRRAADYLVTAVPTSSLITVDAVGFFSEGTQRIDFDLKQRLTALSYAFTYSLASDSGWAVSLGLTVTRGGISAVYSVSYRGTVISLIGNLTQTSTDVNIKLNDVLVARATGDPGAPVIAGVGGRQLVPEEVEAFTIVLGEMLRLPLAVDGIFGPAYRLY
jgi:hypothetical protein